MQILCIVARFSGAVGSGIFERVSELKAASEKERNEREKGSERVEKLFE
jgi:hypothetical protein